MGWCLTGLSAGGTLKAHTAGFVWLAAGGLAYTVGIIFYALDSRLPHAHGIWHLFVLGGSFCHFVCILLYVA